MTYHYTYDSDGNLTVIKDPLTNLTTMTYTANGRLQSTTDANNTQRRIHTTARTGSTTVINPDTRPSSTPTTARGT